MMDDGMILKIFAELFGTAASVLGDFLGKDEEVRSLCDITEDL